jgi:hypothetical protein
MSSVEYAWGTVGPESLGSRRRVRTLGLGSDIRACNEAAVPGTGSLWYGKQLLFAVVGIHLATEVGRNNITVANAIEALACLLGFRDLGQRDPLEQDRRLRGRRKLAGQSIDDLPFKKVSSRSFYVSQPMRMGIGQPLRALGFASGEIERFNALRLTDVGVAFRDAALENYRPYRGTVIQHLLDWIGGGSKGNSTQAMMDALSPLVQLDRRASGLVEEQLQSAKHDGHERRANSMRWVRRITATPGSTSWQHRPDEIAPEHWRDLDAGTRFFAVRDAAVACLDAVEYRMACQGKFSIESSEAVRDQEVEAALHEAATAATNFLALKHAPQGADSATDFAAHLANRGKVEVIEELVKRDGRVLVASLGGIARGSAFDPNVAQGISQSDEIEDVVDEVTTIPLPEGISRRVSNLALLCLDLDGKLDRWLQQQAAGSGGEPQ